MLHYFCLSVLKTIADSNTNILNHGKINDNSTFFLMGLISPVNFMITFNLFILVAIYEIFILVDSLTEDLSAIKFLYYLTL